MSERRHLPPRRFRAGQGDSGPGKGPQRRKGFLERLRAQDKAAARSRPGRARAARPRRRRLSAWQVIAMTAMVLLGVAMVASTCIPFLPGVL